MNKSTLSDFENALYLLDKELMKNNMHIEIKAIGGFAMLYYGIRENGFTIDIDTLTENYNDEIVALIHQVGKELDIDCDWLNNDCTLLDGFLGKLSEDIDWKIGGYKFSNINFKIADIKGLLRSKLKAIEDGGLVPRITDKNDCVHILKYMGIEDIEGLNCNREMSFIENEYPKCYLYLYELKKW